MVKQKLTDELTVTNYVAVPKIEHDDPMFSGLKQIVIDCWTRIFDRYTLSYTNGGYDFYDKEQCDWYAIYEQKKLAQDLRVNPRSVSRYIQKLKEAGLLIVKKTKSGANRYFPLMPKKFTKAKQEANESASNSHKTKSASGQETNWQTNYFISKGLTFITFLNTVNTVNTQTKEKTSHRQSPKDKVQNPGQRTKTELIEERRNMISAQRYENKRRTLRTQLGLSEKMITVLDQYSFGSLSELNMYTEAIFIGKNIAKKSFATDQRVCGQDFYKWAFMLEENEYVIDEFPKELSRIIVTARDKAHEKKANSIEEYNENRFKFMITCFFNYFKDAGARYMQNWIDWNSGAAHTKPTIPLFKLGEQNEDVEDNVSGNNQGTLKHARTDYAKELTPEQEVQLDKMMAALD